MLSCFQLGLNRPSSYKGEKKNWDHQWLSRFLCWQVRKPHLFWQICVHKKLQRQRRGLKRRSKVKSWWEQLRVGGPKLPLRLIFFSCDQTFASIESMEGYPPPPSNLKNFFPFSHDCPHMHPKFPPHKCLFNRCAFENKGIQLT